MILFALFGAITFLSYILIFNSLSFFIGSSKGIAKGATEGVVGSSTYPPGLFEGSFLKIIFMTVLPVYFIAYAPYNLIQDFTWLGFLGLMVGSMFFLGVGVYVFYVDLKRYESGNMMNVNV